MLKAYAVNVKGSTFPARIVYHETAGKAKYQFWIDVREPWPSVKYTDITAYRVRDDREDRIHQEFARTATYREVPFAKIGMTVEVDGVKGEIAGKNSDANFDVLFLEGNHKGQILNCHPNWRIRYFDKNGTLIKEFQDGENPHEESQGRSEVHPMS
jgi:hypothetical protein